MDFKKNMKVNSLIRYSLFVFLIGMMVALVGMTVFFKLIKKSEIVPKSQYEYYSALDDKFGKYYEIENIIENKSIYDLDAKSLEDGFIGTLTGSISDKYIQYYTEEEYEKFNKVYASSYTGIGVSVSNGEDGNVLIKRVIEDGPADKAGIKEGDIIVTIDGEKPDGYSEASDMIRGDAGTEVVVVVKRGSKNKEFKIIREDVDETSVGSAILDEKNHIGYVRIALFKTDTAEDFETAVKGLVKDGCDKIIVDVRSNGGGVMQEGVDSADVILPACKIMTSVDSSGKEQVYNSDESMVAANYVIIVDRGTASASEIFTSAVQDNKGAIIIGETTYGKGLIQGVYQLRDKSRIKITIEEYFRPSGKPINEIGITPDIEVSGENAVQAAMKELTK